MKKVKLIITSSLLTLSMSFTTLAGSWQRDATGWWYQNDDGSYQTNCWQWIDGNEDGIAENYYLDDNGYCLTSTVTPDGYTVNENGAWVIDGVVQTKNLNNANVSNATATTTKNTNSTASATKQSSSTTTQSTSPEISSTVWVSATGEKYHKINNCGRMNPAKARSMSRSEAEKKGYEPCSKCY